MSEFLLIQVGQCGNQLGSALWPRILEEYDVSLSQTPTKVQTNRQEYFSSFFHVPDSKQENTFKSLPELVSNDVKARAICVDMEDSVVARYKTNTLKGLFDDRNLITNYPGSGNNWAEGFCEHGPKYKGKILNSLRHSVERCDSLHGFLMLFSTGGGTGSGLGTYILNLLSDYYPKIESYVSCVYSTGTEDVITSPYNNAFATHQLLQNATCVFPVENRCLMEIANRKYRTNVSNGKINKFNLTDDINSSVVDMLLHLTSGSRFPGSLNFDMNEINTNMVPFSQMNFISAGFDHVGTHEKLNSKRLKEDKFNASYSAANQLIRINPLGPRSLLLASTLIGRGEYTVTDLQRYTEKIQTKAKSSIWSRKSVKVGLCSVPPAGQSLALLSLFNSTGLYSLFEHLSKQYNMLYKKKAHIHHYARISNFDVELFTECDESLQNMMQKYRELESLVPVKIPRLKPNVV